MPKKSFNKMIDDEVHTFTPFKATRSGKKSTAVHKHRSLGGGTLMAQATVLSPGAKSRRQRPWTWNEGRWWWRPATGTMTYLLAATLGPFGGVAAGLSANVLVSFLMCLMTARLFVVSSLLVKGRSSWKRTRRVTPCCPQTWPDFKPPCGTESREAALHRLLTSRVIGGHSLTSDDPAPRSLTVFH